LQFFSCDIGRFRIPKRHAANDYHRHLLNEKFISISSGQIKIKASTGNSTDVHQVRQTKHEQNTASSGRMKSSMIFYRRQYG
jgi:hypothetical protein